MEKNVLGPGIPMPDEDQLIFLGSVVVQNHEEDEENEGNFLRIQEAGAAKHYFASQNAVRFV